MRRIAFFVYGVSAHAMFLVIYAWMAAFVGGFGFGVIPTLDDPPHSPLGQAVLVNALLIAAFGVQHSVMARPAFKRVWTRIIPEPIERSTYVLASNVVMAVLLLLWQPIGGVIWNVADPVGKWALWSLFALGWIGVPAVSLLINHFDLFGTRQVWLHLMGREYMHLPFGTPMAYRVVRHPLYVGWLVAFWATPHMTIAHLIFAIGMSAYILLAIPLEERDLVAAHGRTYEEYRQRVGGLVPRLPKRGKLEELPYASAQRMSQP